MKKTLDFLFGKFAARNISNANIYIETSRVVKLLSTNVDLESAILQLRHTLAFAPA